MYEHHISPALLLQVEFHKVLNLALAGRWKYDARVVFSNSTSKFINCMHEPSL